VLRSAGGEAGFIYGREKARESAAQVLDFLSGKRVPKTFFLRRAYFPQGAKQTSSRQRAECEQLMNLNAVVVETLRSLRLGCV